MPCFFGKANITVLFSLLTDSLLRNIILDYYVIRALFSDMNMYANTNNRKKNYNNLIVQKMSILELSTVTWNQISKSI